MEAASEGDHGSTSLAPAGKPSQNPVRLQTQIVYSAEDTNTTINLPTPALSLNIDQTNSTSLVRGSFTVMVTYVRVEGSPTPYTMPYDLSVVGSNRPPIAPATSDSISLIPTDTTNTNAGSSATSTSESIMAPNSNGLSSGEAAGVRIGAALGGILLASLVFFVCFRRSRKSGPRYDTEVPLKHSPSYGESKPTSPPQRTAISTWESSAGKHLPQPVSDEIISSGMSKLKSMTNNHVVSYYRTSEVGLDVIDETALAGLAENSRISISELTSAIVNPQTRTPALRYLIASAIFSRFGLKGHSSTSFLPPEVVGCLESMTGLQNNDQARTSLLSKWRIITASMLQQTYGSKVITEADPRAYNIDRILDELDSVLLRLRARRDENASRRRNLEEILKRATGFAFLLFSHPSSWVFDWKASLGHEPGSVVVFPNLLQTTDGNGERLGRPRPFKEMETARLTT